MARKKRKPIIARGHLTPPAPAASAPGREKTTPTPPPGAGWADSASMALFVFLLGVVPLAVRARVLDFTAPRIINPLVDTGPQVGLFAYYKWWLVILTALMAVAILLYKVWAHKYRIRPSYLNAPLLVLALLILGSVMAAEYKSIALFGIYNQRDGSLLLLAYLALCLAAANTCFRPRFKDGVDLALMAFTFINAAIMMAAFSGHDLLQSEAVKTLMAPTGLRSVLEGRIGNTLGNANYISGLAAALFAYFAAGALLHRDIRRQATAAATAITAFAMVLLSLSSSGFVTLVLLSPLFAAVMWRRRDRHRGLLSGASLFAACLLVFLILNHLNPKIYHETVGFFLPQATNIQETTLQTPRALPPPAPELQLPRPGWSAGTGRTYIWSETLKLTVQRPWLGSGYGTLTYYFPQDDINKVANLRDYNRLVTKPHSMYMGIAFGLGIPALLTLLYLLGAHCYKTARRLWSHPLDAGDILPVALFLFFCSFAVQALFNDPVVEAGAMFWLLLGVAVALNGQVEQPLADADILL